MILLGVKRMEKNIHEYTELREAPRYEEGASCPPEGFIITRNLPVVNILGKRGFFLFTSRQSYDKFKVTKFKNAKLDADGVGIPLLHMVTKYDITAHISAKKPIYVIYKYVIGELENPPPYSQGELVLQNNIHCLYKVPFCEIYRSRGYTKTSYKLVFPFESESTNECRITEDTISKQFEVSFNGNNLVWDVMSQMNHAFSYGLRVQNSYASDNNFTSSIPPINGTGTAIGKYNPKLFGRVPKMTYACADLWINEKSRLAAYGIASVPCITEHLACQGMLIHPIDEDRRRRRGTDCWNSSYFL